MSYLVIAGMLGFGSLIVAGACFLPPGFLDLLTGFLDVLSDLLDD